MKPSVIVVLALMFSASIEARGISVKWEQAEKIWNESQSVRIEDLQGTTWSMVGSVAKDEDHSNQFAPGQYQFRVGFVSSFETETLPLDHSCNGDDSCTCHPISLKINRKLFTYWFDVHKGREDTNNDKVATTGRGDNIIDMTPVEFNSRGSVTWGYWYPRSYRHDHHVCRIAKAKKVSFSESDLMICNIKPSRNDSDLGKYWLFMR